MWCRAFGRQDGFSLIELMVAMSIFLLILVGIFQVFDPSRNAYQVSERKLDVQQNARVAMDRMSRQLRMAGYFPGGMKLASSLCVAYQFHICAKVWRVRYDDMPVAAMMS